MNSLGDGSVAERQSAASAQGSLAGASEREVTSVSIPNIGPEHPDPGNPGAPETGTRRGNPSPVHRVAVITDDVVAASSRASAVSHRFGGVRYALSRPGGVIVAEPPAEEGESDARD
ncbi:hypothetical protein [Actinoplanes siamensis]|uniref:Uncharacterized protein n=1 Tax=Actinoplanes siamensis TaxID=1223317 RepID=A0A919NC22_9ACTN|nr:hypothetical protein [Actinoplanes siamensis]GIF08351.1 hypothetical protein Asi03nite_58890 [Actinoplanes siamensis]